ncbi:hypothetical protein HYX01_02890 [Candidatus Woesearchaeota archaeon]|nr:hypothetical protein [Candidatus Woesearchaeota archaeon]
MAITIKRLLILQLVFLIILLIIIPIAFGEITITLPKKDIYNYGEKLAPDVSIKEEQDYNGIFKISLICNEYSLQYYTTPLSIKAGFRTQLDVPDIALFSPISGKCFLESDFETVDNEKIGTSSSNEFTVTNLINLEIADTLEAKPSEDVLLTAEIKKHSNEIVASGEAEITFLDKKDNVGIALGRLEHTLHLSKDAEIGNFPIFINAKDKYGNYGDKTIFLSIMPIPTKIENLLENDVIIPGNALKAKIALYDHRGIVMNESIINVKLFAPSDKLIAEKEIIGPGTLEFKTERSQLPGTYLILSTFNDVKRQSSFTVPEIKKISVSSSNNFMNLENIGNVKYSDKVMLTLEGKNKKYTIQKKIALNPEEETSIELSKEVPEGTYDIILPENAVNLEAIKNESNFIAKPNVLKGVNIDDNRPVIKKAAHAFSTVTGAVAGTASYVASNPTLATIIITLIILVTVAYYSKGVIARRVRRKKQYNDSNLFHDFKLENKK